MRQPCACLHVCVERGSHVWTVNNKLYNKKEKAQKKNEKRDDTKETENEMLSRTHVFLWVWVRLWNVLQRWKRWIDQRCCSTMNPHIYMQFCVVVVDRIPFLWNVLLTCERVLSWIRDVAAVRAGCGPCKQRVRHSKPTVILLKLYLFLFFFFYHATVDGLWIHWSRNWTFRTYMDGKAIC